jgi:putative flippase GtrA
MDMGKVFSLDRWLSFIKFNLVGLSGVLVNEGVLLLLALDGVYYVYASALAIEVSIISNFILNDFWTFRDRRHGHIAGRLLKFNGLMIIGLVVNLAILYVGSTYFQIHYAISNLIGIGAAFLVRYELSVRYAWIRKEEVSMEPSTADSPMASVVVFYSTLRNNGLPSRSVSDHPLSSGLSS